MLRSQLYVGLAFRPGTRHICTSAVLNMVPSVLALRTARSHAQKPRGGPPDMHPSKRKKYERRLKAAGTNIEVKPLNVGVKAGITMAHPARQYPLARRLKRHVHLHIGPTNSGKSYTALKAFMAAKTGFYAGPLRMLAREIYDRMAQENIPCNLITGDEILEKPGAGLSSGTVEMMDLARELEVAVIDEIQMIADPSRGWAWTRAFLGVRAHNVHLCGDPNSEQIISALTRETGDVLHVHRYERLSPLEVGKPLLKKKDKKDGKKQSKKSFYKMLEPGDCVVSFSKRNVQSLRDSIVRAHGGTMCCSIIYGSLPPETRAEQARQFNDTKSEVCFLVASDAIGMGLNLGIKRVIFSSLQKFDGNDVRQLDVSEIKQIAGRAGRFRTADGNEGERGVVTSIYEQDILPIKKALAAATPRIQQAVIMPPNHLIRAATVHGGTHGVLFSLVLASAFHFGDTGKYYCRPRLDSATEVASLFDTVPHLTIEDRMVLTNAPVPSQLPVVAAAFQEMCKVIGHGRSVNALQLFPSMMNWLATPRAVGSTLEVVHKTLTLFLWMSYRYPCNFVDRAGATDLKRLCEERFDELLKNSRKNLAGRPEQKVILKTNRALNRATTPRGVNCT